MRIPTISTSNDQQFNMTPMIDVVFLLIIFFILILVFGAKRLSGLGRGVGQMIRGFKDEVQVDEKSEPAKPE